MSRWDTLLNEKPDGEGGWSSSRLTMLVGVSAYALIAVATVAYWGLVLSGRWTAEGETARDLIALVDSIATWAVVMAAPYVAAKVIPALGRFRRTAGKSTAPANDPPEPPAVG